MGRRWRGCGAVGLASGRRWGERTRGFLGALFVWLQLKLAKTGRSSRLFRASPSIGSRYWRRSVDPFGIAEWVAGGYYLPAFLAAMFGFEASGDAAEEPPTPPTPNLEC